LRGRHYQRQAYEGSLPPERENSPRTLEAEEAVSAFRRDSPKKKGFRQRRESVTNSYPHGGEALSRKSSKQTSKETGISERPSPPREEEEGIEPEKGCIYFLRPEKGGGPIAKETGKKPIFYSN